MKKQRITLLISIQKMGNAPVRTAANGKSKPLEPQRILITTEGDEIESGNLKNSQVIYGTFNPYKKSAWFCREMKGHPPLIAIMPTACTTTHQAAQDHVEVFKKLKQFRDHNQSQQAGTGLPVCLRHNKAGLQDKGKLLALPDLPR